MPFCQKCGASYEEGTKFCQSCGAPTAQTQTQQQQTQTQQQQNNYAEKLQNLNNTADTTAEFDPADIEQNKVMGVLSYLSWLVLIPLFGAKQSKFARFHTNQGLVLAITEIVWWIAQSILSSILFAISWRLGFISTILGLVNIAFLVLAIIGIVNAAGGKAKELPIIGKFRILK